MTTQPKWTCPAWLALLAAATLGSSALAQTPAPAAEEGTPEKTVKLEKYIVTGSSIKRPADEGALPMDVFTPQEIEQKGITSVEQMVMQLNINGNAMDNMASNSDVATSVNMRGNNGATAANLRFQGSNATLILLNGRRVAQHGLNGGGVVDLNSIPFMALKRVEVLKDGASSTYGTDAIGGVINFITRDDFQGLIAQSGFDDTQEGGGNIYRYSLVGGYGDLNKDKFNVMAAVSFSDSKLLLGTQRSWVSTQQPDRGVSADTRGTPFATLNGISTLSNVLSRSTATKASFIDPSTGLAVSTVNTLVLQGGTALAGTGMFPYDWQLWGNASAKYGATVDTGKYAALQQPLKNTNLVTSGKYKWGQHLFTLEGVFGRSISTKYFSQQQITSSASATTSATPDGVVVANPLYNLAYPSTGADYTSVFNTLAAYFPNLAGNRGLPMPFRWRFYPGGDRRYSTHSDTWRVLAAAEGPLSFLKDWEYRSGLSRSTSKSYSVLGDGYYFSKGVADLINAGTLDPFSFTQTDAAMTALKATSASGVRLYSGTYTTDEFDTTFSGPVWQLPAGQLMAAAGVDARQERYNLSGQADSKYDTSAGVILNAPFDNTNATHGDLKRNIKAVFAELDVPIIKGVDFDPSVRTDDYSGFGRTTNPKYTLRVVPTEWVLLRGSYSTGFRVPTFAQEYFPTTVATNTSTIIDPANGALISPYDVWGGGKQDLKPEKAKMDSAGIVLSPNKHLTISADWWSIDRTNAIESLSVSQILANYTLFGDRLIRDGSGNLIAIDDRWLNAGEMLTKGIEYDIRGDMTVAGGVLDANFNLSELLEKKSRLLANSPWGASEVGHFTRSTDLGIKYKATTTLGYRRGNWSVVATEVFRSGYVDNYEGTLATATYPTPLPVNWNPKVKPYNLYNLTVSYKGLIKNLTITAGVKNIFNTNPPFSAYYDTNSGGGSDWDPRVGDPRGRSFTLSGEYKFF